MTENEKILSELLKDVQSWSDLKPKLSKFNTSSTDITNKTTRAGKLFEYFTKLCFLYDREFAEEYNFKEIFLYEEIPTELKEKLNLPKVEHGIDLLIIDNEEKVIAIQCKFKNDETVKLNWNSDKLGNFFGFARNANLHCVFSNSSDITQVAQNLTENFKFFSYSHLQNISSETFEKMRNALIGNPIKEIKKPKPHDYQTEAIEAVVNHFKDNERGQLILPCGAGKTLTSLWIKEKLESTNTLVLVPSLALLRQIKSNWNEAYNTKFIRLNVCSEKDIDSDTDNDIAITHTYEILGNVTTDKNLVASFLQKTDNKVIFSTYQSLQVIVDALQILPDFHFDLIIADEAHKTSGFSDQNKFTLVHNNEKVRGLKRLYMTATPRIASPELKAKHSERIKFLKDMSNPKVYGNEAYRMTFGAAIEKEILVKYKIIAVGVSDTDLKKYIEQNIQLTKTENIKDYAHNYALNIVMEKYKANHALTFHSRIKLAENFAKRHNRLVQDVFSTSISGTQTTSQREIILKAFEKADKAVVSNAKCLTEGVDVPVIDIVYYSDPKNSKIDIVQSAGRALRKAKHRNKEMGFIVVPIFHKDRETVEDAIEKSDYKNLITVIRSLCDQDERLVSEINELAWNKEQNKRNATFELTFSDEQTDSVLQFEQIKEKLKNSLFNQVIETLKDSWEIHYKEVEEYYNTNGNSNIPARHKAIDGFGIGTWCVAQRVSFNKGLLSDSEIKKLQKLNFDFDPYKTLFEIDFQELLKFKEAHGHVDVPTMGNYLGRRVNKYRTYYKRGTLNQEKIDRLNSIGFQFILKEIISWDDKFIELKEYYKTHKTNRINSAISSSLYFWESKQRIGNKKNKLNNEQVEKLNSINFEWEIKTFRNRKDKWEDRYEIFKIYWINNYSLPIPKSHSEYEYLNDFIKDIGYDFRKNRLNDIRINKLKEIDFNFNLLNPSETKEVQWDIFYEKLKEIKAIKGNLNIAQTDENKEFNAWVRNQRRIKRNGKLTEEKISLLNEINFSWSNKVIKEKIIKEKILVYDEKWLKKYEELKNHIELNNSFVIPNTNNLKSLHNWIITQRIWKNKNKLTDHRIALLNDIKFPWNGLIGRKRIREITNNKINHIDKWDEMFQNLVNYHSRNKTFFLPEDEEFGVLKRWCLTQRTKYNKNILLQERIKKLDDLGFPWKEKRGRKKLKKETIKKTYFNDQWEIMYNKLYEFYTINRHFRIPLTSENKKLILWLKTQRNNYKNQQLSSDRILKLNTINFPWVSNGKEFINPVNQRDDSDWLKMFDQLFSFIIKHNHTVIPRGDAETKSLALWLMKQRKSYRDGKLSNEQIEKFKRINVDLTYNKKQSFENIWIGHYENLVKFKEMNGHCNPSSTKPNEKSLGTWVLFQRMNRKKNILESFKIDLLDKINFIWDTEMFNKNLTQNDNIWLKKYAKLLEFQKIHNSTIVPQLNNEIGRWVNEQRVNFKRDKLSEFRIEKLNDIGFVWDMKNLKK